MAKYVSYCNEILDEYLPIVKKFKSFEAKTNQADLVQNILERKPELSKTHRGLLEHIKANSLIYKPTCDLVQQAVKFKMSDGGMLFKRDDDVIKFLQKFVDEIKLPFDVIALELPPYFLDDFVQITEQVLLAKQDGDYIYLYTLIKCDDGVWTMPVGPKTQIPLYLKINAKDFSYELIFDFEVNSDDDALFKKGVENTYSWVCLAALTNFICALSCSNTAIEDHPDKPSKLKNAIRKQKGKLPLFTHKVLTINTHKSSTQGISGGNGSHASPRVHLRRGHIRRLPNKNIWVNACVVGDKSKGVIHKDYVVV